MENNNLIKLDDLQKWGEFAKKSGVVPPDVNQYQAMAIIKTGQELGLQTMQSLRSMSFIKGRLTMSVQLQLALAKKLGVIIKSLEENNSKCKVTLKRNGEEITCEYTIEDAKRAGLYREGGSWEKYTRQMLRWRAIGDALRLIAPDLVMGLLSPEEAEAIDTEPIPIEPEPEPEPEPKPEPTQEDLDEGISKLDPPIEDNPDDEKKKCEEIYAEINEILNTHFSKSDQTKWLTAIRKQFKKGLPQLNLQELKLALASIKELVKIQKG